jgi:hypothetical protein
MTLQPAGFLVIPVLYVIQAGVEELGWRGIYSTGSKPCGNPWAPR